MTQHFKMRYKYHFKNSTDILINRGLSRAEHSNFINELKTINTKYDYQMYLAGGYLQYLTFNNEIYNDLNFFILSEKIIDLYELTNFFKEFHGLAKKYQFVYDLMYLINITEDDLNTNPNTYRIFNTDVVKNIKLYYKRSVLGETSSLEKNNFVPIVNTELFEHTDKIDLSVEKYRNKIQKNGFFQKPLKI